MYTYIDIYEIIYVYGSIYIDRGLFASPWHEVPHLQTKTNFCRCRSVSTCDASLEPTISCLLC